MVGGFTAVADAVTIQINYSFDSGNYFGAGSAQRARLEDAAAVFENVLEDDLDAITPTGTYAFFIPESWQVSFRNPSTGGNATVDDLAVPADTIILYVGARNLSGGAISEAGFGGASLFTFPGSSFETAARTRGESGVGTTDFAPWGGFLSVDTGTVFDTTLDGNGSDQHLFSTLVHEIAHVLGLGTAPSWAAQINGSNQFTGSESVADQGGNVPLHFSVGTGRYDHWAEGTMSDIRGTMTPQEAALDPTIAAGTVKLLTNLDWAGLDDIGWDIAAPVPEPSSFLMLIAAGSLLPLRRRR